jgi:hypothetical protein
MCNYTNSVLSFKFRSYFSVPPAKPTFKGFPVGGVGTKGSAITLTCVASGSDTVSRFEWSKNSVKLTSSGEKNAVYTKEGLADTDNGTYSCIAANDAGKSESDKRTLIVLGKQSRHTGKYAHKLYT